MSVTFEWTEPHPCGGRCAVYLDDEIKMSVVVMAWQRVLAANLAMGALLGRAADVGYHQGRCDEAAFANRSPEPYCNGYPTGGL